MKQSLFQYLQYIKSLTLYLRKWYTSTYYIEFKYILNIMNNKLTLENSMQMLAYFTPILFMSFSIMLLLMDNTPDTAASVSLFILGALILYCINVAVSSLHGSSDVNIEDMKNEMHEKCLYFNMGSFNFSPGKMLSNSLSFTYYMWTTLIGCMMESKNINIFMLLVFSFLVVNHTYHYSTLQCSSNNRIAASILLGLGWSVTWYFIVQSINPKWSLLYTNSKSNRTRCGKISKKQFQCKVYKNGRLISR